MENNSEIKEDNNDNDEEEENEALKQELSIVTKY
jgi:hypothetical protein